VTHDEIIANGYWSGDILELRKRTAEYTVNGKRLGSIDWRTKSGHSGDTMLEKSDSEVLTAAFVLARLNHERVAITSVDSDGAQLERPDLDARFEDGTEVGIEVADVGQTDEMKHEAAVNFIEYSISNLLETDATFAQAFGPWFLSVNLNPIGTWKKVPISSKKEARQILGDVEAFIRAGEHRKPVTRTLTAFPDAYSTLRARGAEYTASPFASGAYFDLGDGSGAMASSDEYDEVLRVLDKHRSSAADYRPKRLWMIMYLTSSYEVFRRTVEAADAKRPPIAPFERCYISDGVGRLLELP
jgi:hypothetical protein